MSLILVMALLSSSLAAPLSATVRQTGADTVLADGTEITVVTTDEISSKTATEGDPLSFKVEEDVVVGGKTVIKAGSLVKGSVSNAAKSGRLGKAGQLSIRIESTTAVDGQRVKLRASKGKEGDDKTGTTVALVVLFGPLGFLKKGKNAIIKEGTKIKAFTDEEKKIQAL
ncbi:MAG: hypothetical protein WKF84_03960 [Pyrinomonadaceae bacterium]